ncbi:uncharacterized protein LOC110857749 isoform X2 [Folsomia candida]|uniref:uncharacterized protein LOC110857749 isoform X2 n=1 Tax=Folsomia candida TaxID=158441 RepID=UPI00160537C6|nr:uncharacterized protein LOC110857749 isoform X2 [Folsomia candida]
MEKEFNRVVDLAPKTPFLNPLILEKVFSFLDDATSLKSVRLVCSVWAEVGVKPLGRKVGVFFNSVDFCAICRHDKEPSKDINYFNPQLAKKVNIIIGCHCSSCFLFQEDSLPGKLVTILPQIGDHVETLDLFKWIDPIPKCCIVTHSGDVMVEIKAPKLKTFHFSGCDGYGLNLHGTCEQVKAIVQDVLYTAKNLEEFHSESCFKQLDLSFCPKIKISNIKCTKDIHNFSVELW